MKTLTQVLDNQTNQLRDIAWDSSLDGPARDCRYRKVGDGSFDMWAGVAGDALQALNQAGALGEQWPTFTDHYCPESLQDGNWEPLDIMGPYLYIGTTYDRVNYRTSWFVWTFSYSEFGCEFGKTIAIENPYDSDR